MRSGLLLIFIAFAFINELAAQQRLDFTSLDEPDNDLFRRTHWEFSIYANVNAAAQTTSVPGAKYGFDNKPQLSYEAGIDRTTQLQKNLGILVGLHGGVVGRDEFFVVPNKEVGYDRDDEFTNVGPFSKLWDVIYLSLPLQMEYRSFSGESTMFFVSGGLSLRYAPFNGRVTIVEAPIGEVMRLDLESHKKPFINGNAGAGVGYLLRNKNILKMGFNVNYDPSYIAKGKYTLQTQSSYNEGEYTVRGNSVGLYLKYVLTKSAGWFR